MFLYLGSRAWVSVRRSSSSIATPGWHGYKLQTNSSSVWKYGRRISCGISPGPGPFQSSMSIAGRMPKYCFRHERQIRVGLGNLCFSTGAAGAVASDAKATHDIAHGGYRLGCDMCWGYSACSPLVEPLSRIPTKMTQPRASGWGRAMLLKTPSQ